MFLLSFVGYNILMSNNVQKTYSAEEYKELVEKITQGKATKDEIESVKFLVFVAVKEIDSILKDNK